MLWAVDTVQSVIISPLNLPLITPLSKKLSRSHPLLQIAFYVEVPEADQDEEAFYMQSISFQQMTGSMLHKDTHEKALPTRHLVENFNLWCVS